MSGKEILKQYEGKQIKIEEYMDEKFRIAGYPQLNRIVKVNNDVVYKQSEHNYDKMSRETVDELMKFVKKIGQYSTYDNWMYGMREYSYNFIVSRELINLVYGE